MLISGFLEKNFAELWCIKNLFLYQILNKY